MNQPAAEKTLRKLTKEESVGYFLQGSEKWNELVSRYDEMHFDFSDVDWDNYIQLLSQLNGNKQLPNNLLSFKGYKFKSGILDFSRSNFRYLSVDLSGADLGNTSLIFDDTEILGASIDLSNITIGIGTIHMAGARFGHRNRDFYLNLENVSISKGDLVCSDAVFYKGEKNFSFLKLEQGSIDFSGTVFGDGDFCLFKSHICGEDFDFISCVFGKGKKDLSQSIFNVSRVCFSGTNFGEGIVSFSACDFSKVKNWVHFQGVILRGYSLIFLGATCAGFKFDFSGSVFENKIIDFSSLDFANGNYNFESCEFHGRVSFSDEEENTSTAQSLSFRKSIFHSTLDISGVNTASIIDLRETKLSTHTTLDNLGFKLARRKVFKFVPGILEATSKDDASKLRRLKEIAETNKNHTAALRFHAAEMRARRWHDMPAFSSILDAAFSMLSNYGQSIFRPFIAWLVVVFGYSAVYSGMFNTLSSELSFADMYAQSDFGSGFLYSLIQTLPVFPVSRALQQDLYLKLSNHLTYEWLSVLTISQNLLGVIFLFLIGLGLRNRFRL